MQSRKHHIGKYMKHVAHCSLTCAVYVIIWS